MKKARRINELKIGDKIIGKNGIISIIDVIPEHIPNRMFKLTFKEGVVKCSGDHLWTVYDKHGRSATVETIDIFSSKNRKNIMFGSIDGPKLKSIKEIKPEPVSCIVVDSDDHLFELSLPKGKILTHNCQFRAGCGRLGSIASMMLFGNTIATTVDGNHPGAGMISSNGAISSIQYYFEDISWINGFYKACGFDEKGFRSTNIVVEDDATDNDTDIDDLDNILDFKHDIETIEIDGLEAEFDKTKRQEFDS